MTKKSQTPGASPQLGFTEALTAKIDGWFYRAHGGREMFPVPWAPSEMPFDRTIPEYAKERHLPVGMVTGAGVGFLLLGWSFHAKVLAALGAALLMMVGLAWRRTWKQCGQLQFGLPASRCKLHERDELQLNVHVTNTGATTSEPAMLHCVFAGSIEPEQYATVEPLAKGERATLTFRYKLDRGMGEFRVDALALVVRDPLGMYARSIRENVDFTVEVVPEESTMEPLQVHVAGATMHSGVFEAKLSGDSPTFLGLRPFRSGDSIRRIDWKRSQRHRELVVREYERLNSTDATIILDTRSLGVFEYGSLNSFELMRDTVLAVVKSLLEQQIRVRLVTQELSTEMNKGRMHFDLIIDLVRTLRGGADGSYEALVKDTMEIVPPDSVVIPMFFQAGVDLGQLVELLLTAEHNRIETIPIMINTESFEAAITVAANFSSEQQSALAYVKKNHISGSTGQHHAGTIPDQLMEKTIVIGAGETITSVYRRGH